MKPIPPPDDIAQYTRDAQAEWTYRLPKIALGVLALFGLLGIFVFMKTEYGTPICGILFLGSLGFLCWFSSKKRSIACNRCGRSMAVLDVDWSIGLFEQLGGRIWGSFFAGADGRIYKEGRYRSQGTASYTIDLMKQRWYACHDCKRCLLGEKLLPVTIFHASSGLRQVINNLKQDPNAGSAMEQRNAQDN